MIQHPHRRFNPLKNEWILVSPHRTQRPWNGQQETTAKENRPYEPDCYLCPGNTRANGERNPDYENTFVFPNDYAALLPEVSDPAEENGDLFRSMAVTGECRVICFHPRHDLTLPELSPDEIRAVIRVWMEQTAELGEKYRWVQVFENKGAVMGCSNPHPHGQVWASSFLPNEIATEDGCQHAYFAKRGRSLLLDYVEQEIERAERTVIVNDDWAVIVPYWAVWPFETLVLPRASVRRITDLSGSQVETLAGTLKELATRYDNLFETSFPYSMGWHGAPFGSESEQPHWQLHAHFYPPLLRSASVKKFMVGYELLAEAQRDLTPETAAERLRALATVHYKTRSS